LQRYYKIIYYPQLLKGRGLKKILYLGLLLVLFAGFLSCKKQSTSNVYAILVIGDYGRNYQKTFLAKKLKSYIQSYGLTNKYKVFTLNSFEECKCNKFGKVFVIEPKQIDVKELSYKDKNYCVKVLVSPIVEFKVIEQGKVAYSSFETVKVEEEKCNDYSYPEIDIKSVKRKALDKISTLLIKKLF
jgi:hypothetical protein